MQTGEVNPTDAPPAENAGPTKKKIKLSFDEFKSITNMLVTYLRNEEENTDSDGVRKSDLINWYLEQISDQIDTEEELVEKKVMIGKVIHRLIYSDQVIIPLKASVSGEDADEEDDLLVVHPNYVVGV